MLWLWLSLWPVSTSAALSSTFTAPGKFPTSLYSKYYNSPTQTSAQVQPVITDISGHVYPLKLTDPHDIPQENADPHPLPPKASSSLLLSHAVTQIHSIAASPVYANSWFFTTFSNF